MILKQPRSVYAVAFACVVAFMGIGLVDPILPVLAEDLQATPSEVSLLFTSYMAVMGVAMLVTGARYALSALAGSPVFSTPVRVHLGVLAALFLAPEASADALGMPIVLLAYGTLREA